MSKAQGTTCGCSGVHGEYGPGSDVDTMPFMMYMTNNYTYCGYLYVLLLVVRNQEMYIASVVIADFALVHLHIVSGKATLIMA